CPTTPCNSASASTPPKPPSPAPRWPARRSHHTSFATQRPCACCKPATTSPSSPCGLGTPTSPPHRSTCKPTWPSNSKPSTGPPRQQPSQAATNRPTSCWPSWKPSDYADIPHPAPPAHQHFPARYRHNRGVGVMRQANCMTGQVRPAVVEIASIPVVHRDPGEGGENPERGERAQVPAAQVIGDRGLGGRREHVLL